MNGHEAKVQNENERKTIQNLQLTNDQGQGEDDNFGLNSTIGGDVVVSFRDNHANYFLIFRT
jgi:hypothetical protein